MRTRKSNPVVVDTALTSDYLLESEKNNVGDPPIKDPEQQEQGKEQNSSNQCSNGFFRWWMYLTAAVYVLMFLLASGSLVFTLVFDYWWNIEFETDRERDFFQLAMVGFSALFAWVLASMWVAYTVEHDGWAFLSSLPSLGIIALGVVVMAT
jgi:hypothetical protein